MAGSVCAIMDNAICALTQREAGGYPHVTLLWSQAGATGAVVALYHEDPDISFRGTRFSSPHPAFMQRALLCRPLVHSPPGEAADCKSYDTLN